MKRIDLGQAIAILANLGVIAGIVFLAIELQQNNELLAAQARGALADRRTEFAEILASNPSLAAVVVKVGDGTALTEVERLQFHMLGRRLFMSFESQYLEVEEGIVPEASLPIRQWRSMFYGGPGPDFKLSAAWEAYRAEAQPTFVEFWDREIVEPGPPK
jgi:hypothetical protein